MEIIINSSGDTYYSSGCSRDDDSDCGCDSHSEGSDDSVNNVCSQAASQED